MADLAWWFGFSPAQIEDLDIDDFYMWLEQANRQIKAKYTKSHI